MGVLSLGNRRQANVNVKGLVQVPKNWGSRFHEEEKDENIVSNKLRRDKFPLYEDSKADFSQVHSLSVALTKG